MTVTRPVNELLADAVYYQSYHLLENSTWYGDIEEDELNKMKKESAI